MNLSIKGIYVWIKTHIDFTLVVMLCLMKLNILFFSFFPLFLLLIMFTDIYNLCIFFLCPVVVLVIITILHMSHFHFFILPIILWIIGVHLFLYLHLTQICFTFYSYRVCIYVLHNLCLCLQNLYVCLYYTKLYYLFFVNLCLQYRIMFNEILW